MSIVEKTVRWSVSAISLGRERNDSSDGLGDDNCLKTILLDVDSKIPNLALMKISQWLKQNGEEPLLHQMHGGMVLPLEQASHVWASCVFRWNRPIAIGIQTHYQSLGIPVHIGGSGVSLQTKLPDHIESLVPDYSLYGEKEDRAVGFVQRGCIRKCEFCIVPEKEGRLADNVYRPLEEWVPQGFDKILLLDNEFAASPHEQEVLDSVKKHGWKLSITQGYDLRCVTPEKAAKLALHKPYDLKFRERRLYCAWDYFAIEPYVKKGIETLLKAGFEGREIMCYCLVGFNTSHLQDYYRVHLLWNKYEVLPFLMRYNMRKDDPFLNALACYTNRGPALYRNVSFIDYCKQKAPKLVEEATEIVHFCESGEHPNYTISTEQSAEKK